MKKYYRIVWKEIALRLSFHLIYMCAIASLPYIIKYMIDCKFKQGYMDVVKWTSLFVGAIIIGMIAQYISQRSAWKLDEKFYKCIRRDYFNEIISKTSDEFEEKTIGQYSSELNNNIEGCEEYIEYCMEICESVIGLVVYAVYILMLDIRIAIIIYIAAIATLFLPRVTGKKLSNKKQTLLANTGEYTNKVMDLLKGFSFINRTTIKSFNNEHSRHLDKMENSRYSYGSYKTFANVLNGSVMYIVNTAAFAIIAVLLCMGSITVGVATATISYIQDFMFPLRTIIDSVSAVKSVEGVKDDIISRLENVREVSDGELSFEKYIKVDNISVEFTDFAIRNKSCLFKKGQSYVIIGDSGTGKSTLLKAIAGRLAVNEGNIYIDEEKLDFDRSNQLMFYSQQKSHIFDAGYEDNVTIFGSYDIKPDWDILKELDGYNSICNTQTCSDLSGGERQLVLLNRALFSGKEILLLDEPFSAMNKELEYKVTERLLGMGRTIIMITHNSDERYLELFDNVVNIS